MAKVEGKVLRREGLVVSCNLYPPCCHQLPVHQPVCLCCGRQDHALPVHFACVSLEVAAYALPAVFLV